MGDVAIVAIPEKEDYVWKLSSEKVPHMTLLNLGDALSDDDIAHVMEYIDHAANMSLTRFYMSVDRRGPLGSNDADVLFFDKGSCGPEMAAAIDRFRSYLLREDKIKTAYDVAPQYEDWTPHLTLGYPETPAKPDLREYSGIHGMAFDKIALWVDDYAGPEFELATHGSALAMSATDDEPLEQSGVKGMKWGQRKEDMKWARSLTPEQGHAVLKETFTQLGKQPDTSARWAGKDLTWGSENRKAYDKEVTDNWDRLVNDAVKKVVGDSPNGTVTLEARFNNRDQICFRAKKVVVHDEGDIFVIDVDRDDEGLIIGYTPAEEFLEQSGVKGMKWGVRKDDRGHGLTMFMMKNGASKADIATIKRGFARVAGTARIGVAMTNRRYKGTDLTTNAKLRKKYESEITEVMSRGINSGLKNTLANVGTAAGIVGLAATAPASAPAALAAGTLSMGYRVYTLTQQVGEGVRVYDKGVIKHADEGVIIPIIFEYDNNGLIKGLRLDGIPEDGTTEIEHANLNNTLAHVGVKGMKWGVRRTREQRKAARTEQAQRHVDHARARELMGKKVSSLSNEELAFVNQRRQLETNYAKLNPSKSGRRKKKIENHLNTLGLIEKTFTATQQPVAQLAIKRAGKNLANPTAKKILKALIKP